MLIGTKEAAEELGVTPQRICVLIRKKRLPAVKVKGSWIIKESDLELVRERKPGRPQDK